MPIIKFVNESEKIEYPTEQDVCSLLCYAFAPQKTIMNDNQFVGCKPFGFPFWYMRNPLAVHQFMEFNHKRQFKHRKDLAKHRVISFSKEENLGKIRDANRIFQLSHVLLPSKKTHYCKCNIMCKSAQVPRIIEAVIMLRSIWLPYSSRRTFPHGWLQTLPPA